MSMITPPAASAAASWSGHTAARPLVTGLEGGSGSTIGPDGGAMDVAFLGRTAYALVTLVGPDVGGSDTVGIYRVDGPDSFTVVADIGAFALSSPPEPEFFIPTGVQYALDTYRGGFLVTDGHHNRVLRVTLDGAVTELIAFGDVVPTGLAVSGKTVYMAEAGPIPHLPQDGKVNRCGTFTVIADGLNQPTSLELIRNTAYVVTLTGEIWTINNVSGQPHGGWRGAGWA